MDKTLEEIGQALFKHWFIDFEFPNEKGKPYKSSGGEMADSELGEIPKEWEVKNLGEIIELGYGKGLRENRRKNGVYPVVGSSGIVGFHDEYLVQGPGIVIGRKGTIGEVIWVNSNFFPIDTTFYVASKIGKVDLYYFYYLLLTQDFPRIGSDSAVPGLNRNFAYMNLKPAPPVDLINKFNHICKSLFEMMALKKEEISVLGRVCDSLLPKLMSGQIRVPAE
jgi:type I restriction enzyme S subunit